MLFAVVLIVVLNLPPPAERGVKTVAREVIAPMQETVSGFGARLKEASSSIRGLGGMAAKNREMSKELTRLRNEVRLANRFSDENVRLRSALRLQREHPEKLVACEVIARDVCGWWRTVRVSKIRGSKIAIDSAVITADGLVGKVVSVSQNTADILLLSDPTCRVSVRIERLSCAGVLYGRRSLKSGRALCRMDFINKDAKVRAGDEVFTSGLGGLFPKSLLVGRITKIYEGPSGLYQYADVVPSADLGNLGLLFVVVSDDLPDESATKETAR
jgi:rod shape-determining protein MreC